MNKINSVLLIFSMVLVSFCCIGQESISKDIYTYKKGDPNGIGKWYLGREIAHVMGYQGMDWLNRPERETEENVSSLILNMDIDGDDIIADIGAGSGYHTFKMAALLNNGFVFGVDIQDEMLAAMKAQMEQERVRNVKLIKGAEKSVNLPENSVDKILMVDVYHEFSFPWEMINSIKKALRRDGKIYLVEYRDEDPSVPIKKVHKMSEAQAIKEMDLAGLKLIENIGNLPWQHCMVFVKK